ncbi:MAG TPA: SPFH domain-containing protein [Solirubrobacteraceae bacterium]|jgi:regulator of protease activity HflC (stomatin/prohibitin superfamily)|nr:SPFH domain-containing protein [Solirubrobacteraceae bacterium]
MNQLVQPADDPDDPDVTVVAHAGARVEIHERRVWAISGWLGLIVAGGLVYLTVLAGGSSTPALALAPAVPAFLVLTALIIVVPGQTKVVRFFGSYVGTVRRAGFWWILPLSERRNLSIRVRNFETNHLKVNDADGNPVEIACIVVWQVADTARACYAVEDYVNFVRVQAESALRHVATTHPYDDPTGEGTSLRGSTDILAGELAAEMARRVTIAGVEIVEVRISHLAYAPEIAQAMLRRQQANAIVAARTRIIEGAVGMVEMALARLDARGVVELDEERKAAMVSNLLVVLCADQPASPVVNTGTLYT